MTVSMKNIANIILSVLLIQINHTVSQSTSVNIGKNVFEKLYDSEIMITIRYPIKVCFEMNRSTKINNVIISGATKNYVLSEFKNIALSRRGKCDTKHLFLYNSNKRVSMMFSILSYDGKNVRNGSILIFYFSILTYLFY